MSEPAPNALPKPDFRFTTLGRTGLRVHRLGLSASYGIDARGVEEAVDRGVNYVYWGTRRSGPFGEGIRNVCARGGRDKIIVLIQSYTRVGCLLGPSLQVALSRLKLDHADVLLLGWWNKAPGPGIVEAALRLQERGLVKHLALSTHERPLLPSLASAGSPFDIFHVRYNAAHRGAEREVFAPLPLERTQRPGIVAFTATRWATLLQPIDGGGALNDRIPSAADCYRFVLSHPQVDLSLTGPRTGADMRAALDALEKGPMDEGELAWMRAFGDRVRADSQKATPFSLAYWRNASAK